jgi:hypothetical protein
MKATMHLRDRVFQDVKLRRVHLYVHAQNVLGSLLLNPSNALLGLYIMSVEDQNLSRVPSEPYLHHFNSLLQILRHLGSAFPAFCTACSM